MTTIELQAIEAIKEAWSTYLQLQEMHPDDQNDFRFHIHALQNIILAREGQRVLSGIELSAATTQLKNIPVHSYVEGGIVNGNTTNIS